MHMIYHRSECWCKQMRKFQQKQVKSMFAEDWNIHEQSLKKDIKFAWHEKVYSSHNSLSLSFFLSFPPPPPPLSLFLSFINGAVANLIFR